MKKIRFFPEHNAILHMDGDKTLGTYSYSKAIKSLFPDSVYQLNGNAIWLSDTNPVSTIYLYPSQICKVVSQNVTYDIPMPDMIVSLFPATNGKLHWYSSHFFFTDNPNRLDEQSNLYRIPYPLICFSPIKTSYYKYEKLPNQQKAFSHMVSAKSDLFTYYEKYKINQARHKKVIPFSFAPDAKDIKEMLTAWSQLDLDHYIDKNKNNDKTIGYIPTLGKLMNSLNGKFKINSHSYRAMRDLMESLDEI